MDRSCWNADCSPFDTPWSIIVFLAIHCLPIAPRHRRVHPFHLPELLSPLREKLLCEVDLLPHRLFQSIYYEMLKLRPELEGTEKLAGHTMGSSVSHRAASHPEKELPWNFSLKYF